MKKGVDISTWNGNVDFNELKKAGIEFVIIRCGYGSDIKDQDDERFLQNVEKAEKCEMPYGVYLYSYANTLEKAKSEAAHTIRLLKGKKPLYGVWYDVEDAIMPKKKELLTDICVTYCDMLEKAGYYCGIYATVSWLNDRFESKRIARFDKWVAQWNNRCTYKGEYGIWQYTDCLTIGGKAFDGNYAYKDYPAIIGGLNEPLKAEKSIDELAQEVLDGKHGDGAERKKSLGDQYEAVQKRVNEILKAKTALKKGDIVKLSKNAVVYGKKIKFASFVYSSKLYVRDIDGSRVTISTQKSGDITGVVDKKYLIKQ